jgi:hypothetical protein
MRIDFRWIKDTNGALDRNFVGALARHFGLTAFVETGTYMGDTVANLADLFERLTSIELAPELAAQARVRFATQPHVSIIGADSSEGLKIAFNRIPDQPALIWLDAHYSGGTTARGDGNTPVLAEVEQILTMRDGRDVILVDDVRYFWPVPPGFRDHFSLHGYPMLGEVAERLSSMRAPYEPIMLGDALLALPKKRAATYCVSDVAAACTQSRFRPPGAEVDHAIELAIKAAAMHERLALLDLPPLLEAQRDYGLGGHFYYWRGILLESEGRDTEAIRDLQFAERCGVIPSDRVASRASD